MNWEIPLAPAQPLFQNLRAAATVVQPRYCPPPTRPAKGISRDSFPLPGNTDRHDSTKRRRVHGNGDLSEALARVGMREDGRTGMYCTLFLTQYHTI